MMTGDILYQLFESIPGGETYAITRQYAQFFAYRYIGGIDNEWELLSPICDTADQAFGHIEDNRAVSEAVRNAKSSPPMPKTLEEEVEALCENGASPDDWVRFIKEKIQ
jgi:hypothetical protein